MAMAEPVWVSILVLVVVGTHAQESRLMPDYMHHPCIRPCEDDVAPMTCRYRFAVESYQTLSRACYNCAEGNVTDCLRDHCVPANGFSRNIKTVNRGIPGPTIQVCEGDTIIVDMENYFSMAEGVSIHWHGILQLLSPHMDGVGMITQCPIQTFCTFQYKFLAIDPGTHFWHAHTGLQRGDGMFGSLIVRQSPTREPQTGNYDFDLPEHVIVVNEWQNRPLLEIYTDFNYAGGPQSADAVMINGRTNSTTGPDTLPLSVFEVKPGSRYRFRVINSGSLFCPLTISVDGHKLRLIATDGRAFEGFDVDSFDIYSAERYDFVLTADAPVGDYWMRATGLGTCSTANLEGLAVVRYLSDNRASEQLSAANMPPVVAHPILPSKPFNSLSVEATQPLGDTRDQIVGMNAMYPDDISLTGTPDHQFLLEFKVNMVDNKHYYDPDLYPPDQGPYKSTPSAQINGISNRLGPVSLLSQMSEVPPEMFCNSSSVGEKCETEWCECVHKLTVKQDEIVEMVLISPTGQGFTHPVHLHGYCFRVVGMGRGPEGIMSRELFREMDARGEIPRKLSRAPFKDTVPIPNGGYTIFRFLANNPGVWFMHCHLAFHAEIGMALSVEVLDRNGGLPPSPPNFPTCGHFEEPSDFLMSRQKENDASSSGGNGNFLGSGNGNLQSDTAAQSVTAQWVVPVIISMGIVISGLLIVIVQMCRKTRKMGEERFFCFPKYDAQGEYVRKDAFGKEDKDLYLPSKKQEKIKLTQC